MVYYHVWIERRSTREDEVRLDLTEQQVNDLLVEPYTRSKPIAITGRPVPMDDIRHLQINKTSQDSHQLKPKLQRLRQGQSALVGNSIELLVATSGLEVTGEFITTTSGGAADIQPSPDSREVFVVHGRNLAARDALFTFLRIIGLHPLEWSEVLQSTGKTAPYVGEILDAAFSRAHAIVVLFTPDDEARLKETFRNPNDSNVEDEFMGQARPNVLFEAGMAMGHSQDRTILLELGVLRPFSDVAGRHAIRLDNTTQRRQDLAQRLRIAGCPVDVDGTDWHSAGDFESAVDSGNSPLESQPIPHSVGSQPPVPPIPQLSADAVCLLEEAVAADDRTLLKIRTIRGMTIRVNRRHFGEMGDPRSEARWESALNELILGGLVEDRRKDDKLFEVTHKGFSTADDQSGNSPMPNL